MTVLMVSAALETPTTHTLLIKGVEVHPLN